MNQEELKGYHKDQAARARKIYIQSRLPSTDVADWKVALLDARRSIKEALRASKYLEEIKAAALADLEHTRVFRYALAPPLSKDQFALCYPISKDIRKRQERALATANAFAQSIEDRRDKALTPWLSAGRKPTSQELKKFFWAIAPLLAQQQFATAQRNRLARLQESQIVAILNECGWMKLPSSLLDTKAALPKKHYMHKTRFATSTTTPQEVDVALGLPGTVVLAMECKVSNDETNSVKRVNDVLKKAHAWKDHWGSFVKTAAVLQGVIGAKDVMRLLDGGVEVFWSHDLPRFERWLSQNS
ncbi:XamI family restriction endonuclease [Xanthomonas translucens pv. undulosa]|uniref:XamI family restriction endonuclease n=1 Tax=Xanthomonas campestris pv. translucens TaxID=343 RepID=UPI003CF17E80